MKVKILCGVSGSGKSTYIANNFPKATVCSADHFFIADNGEYVFDSKKLSEAHAYCLRKFVQHLQAPGLTGGQVGTLVVDNTNTSMQEVAPYAALANAYGFDTEIIVLQADPVEAHKRNQHCVPLKSVMGQFDRLRGLEKSLPPWWKVVKVGRNEQASSEDTVGA